MSIPAAHTIGWLKRIESGTHFRHVDAEITIMVRTATRIVRVGIAAHGQPEQDAR